MNPIPQEISDFYTFDPATGDIVSRRTGRVVTTKTPEGYVVIRFQKKKYTAHRVGWFLHNKSQPSGEVDHINGKRDDNRISNLRLTDRRTNAQNMRRPYAKKKWDAPLGVAWHERAKKWRAMIWDGHKNRYLGLFEDKDEAHHAYIEAKRQLHRGCTI